MDGTSKATQPHAHPSYLGQGRAAAPQVKLSLGRFDRSDCFPILLFLHSVRQGVSFRPELQLIFAKPCTVSLSVQFLSCQKYHRIMQETISLQNVR